MGFMIGLFFGFLGWFVLRYVVFGLFTVDQNERAVKTTFGRAHRLGSHTTLDTPLAETLRPDERSRYAHPQVAVIGPGGPYVKWPWEKVHKVSVAIETMNISRDPEDPNANRRGTELEAVTKDQLNTGLNGQIRYRVSERNLYAYLFGVKNPIVHVMGYFISILRERVANFEAPPTSHGRGQAPVDAQVVRGISINDLRKNLRDLNEHMDRECASAEARYGIELDATLITEINPPPEVDSALAAINTAHNHVSSEISLAQAAADQKIVQSRRAVEIETLKAQAEVEPLLALANQLGALKASGGREALDAYVRNLRLGLLPRVDHVYLEAEP